MLALTLMASLWLTGTGCGEQAPSFSSTDITDSNLGPNFDFGLRDPSGRVRKLADFHGQVTVLFFGFTQCPDACPTALSRYAAIKRSLGEDADKLAVVFISLDPERDTPRLLANYVATFDPAFVALRGDASATRKAADAFHIYYRKVATGGSYTLDHSVLGFVFDGRGRPRLLLRPDQEMSDVTRDLKLLIDTTA